MRNRRPPLMLFAAGLGTRMRPLTDARPKPLVEVAGRPLIDHALDLAGAAGIGRIVVNLHYLPGQIRDHLAGRSGIAFSEEGMLLDTGGGLKKALPLLGDGPVLTLNTDAVWTDPLALKALLSAWDPARMEALLLLVPKERALGHAGPGDFLPGPDGRLRRGPGAVYTGAQILKTGRLAEIEDPAFSLNRVWDAMIAAGGLFGTMAAGAWCDVGRPGSIALAEAMLGAADVRR